MDDEAIWLSDQADLHSLGLNIEGDIIALKFFCYFKSVKRSQLNKRSWPREHYFRKKQKIHQKKNF